MYNLCQLIIVRASSTKEDEVFASDGEIEELLYVHKEETPIEPELTELDEHKQRVLLSPFQSTKEEILASLFDLLWTRMASLLTPCIFQLLKKGSHSLR